MKVALVNTNSYLEPPVIPVGLEHLLRPLERAGHEASVCDLSFSASPCEDLVYFLEDCSPDVVGMTLRNIDTTLFRDNLSFLESARSLVECSKAARGVPVVVGGASSLCASESLRLRLGADHLVAGPGELAFPSLLEAVETGGAPPVIDGWALGIAPSEVHSRGELLEYGRYLENGGLAGLEFRKGCDWDCPFCVERSRPVLAREPGAVVLEAASLAEKGAEQLFMCDSEVNLDLEGTAGFLEELAAARLGLDWSGYFRPVPFSRRLASLAARSGCSSLTLSVNSWDLSRRGSRYGEKDVLDFCRLSSEEGIKVAVDLLVGYPGEPPGSVERSLEVLESAGPMTVGVNDYLRLYESTPMLDIAARADPSGLIGDRESAEGLLNGAFYRGLEPGRLEDLLRERPLFELAGSTRGVNYQKV